MLIVWTHTHTHNEMSIILNMTTKIIIYELRRTSICACMYSSMYREISLQCLRRCTSHGEVLAGTR